jgi:predicted metal-dependent hydrolase
MNIYEMSKIFYKTANENADLEAERILKAIMHRINDLYQTEDEDEELTHDELKETAKEILERINYKLGIIPTAFDIRNGIWDGSIKDWLGEP